MNPLFGIHTAPHALEIGDTSRQNAVAEVNQTRGLEGPLAVLSIHRQFETFSYLPPLTSDQIGKQVDYIVENGWTPCLEFAETNTAYVSNASCIRFGAVTAVSRSNLLAR
jgi:hypothetical protein